MTYEQTLAALADGTRRRLFERLGRRDHTVGELASELGISQPAVSQHLRVLEEASLVLNRPEGARRYYRASPEGLAELRRYLESQWDQVLGAFAEQKPKVKSKGRKR